MGSSNGGGVSGKKARNRIVRLGGVVIASLFLCMLALSILRSGRTVAPSSQLRIHSGRNDACHSAVQKLIDGTTRKSFTTSRTCNPVILLGVCSFLHVFFWNAANIHLVAFDFDMTIVNTHTGGRWEGTAEELAPHVRPSFQCYIAACLDRGLNVAIATFSTQTILIQFVLNATILSSTDLKGKRLYIEIPVFGGDLRLPGYRKGKQSQLYAAREWARSKRLSASGIDDNVRVRNTILIDDDPDNIRIALQDGYRTIHYDPDDEDDNNLYNSKLM
jgi:hypothetical protein